MNPGKMKDKFESKVVKKLNYFDYAATAPMREEALTSYVEAARKFYGNTQSLHDVGSAAQRVLQKCKHIWADHLQVSPDSVFFTGSATEGNQLAIRSLVKGKQGTILVCPLEHASILTVVHELKSEGFAIEWLPLTERGVVDLQKTNDMLSDEVILVVCQWVNSETGILQPIKEILSLVKRKSIPLHCDAVQGFGKCTLTGWQQDVASFVISGHKFGGPKGCGVCLINPDFHWSSVYPGTTHQFGFRAGTVDIPSIVATTEAAFISLKEQHDLYANVQKFHMRVVNALPETVEYVGQGTTKSPFIVGLSGFGVDGQHTMLEANRHGISISTGSACKVGHGEAMSTLSALGYEEDVARQFVRISFGYLTTEREVENLIKWIRSYKVERDLR